jgi:spore coat protein CotH
MTAFRNVFAVCAFAAPLAVGAQDHPAAGAEHEQHAQAGDAAGDRSGTEAHEHMRAMREQMARIQATQDAGERERLMHEHMQSMQQHMQMMSSMRPQGGMGDERMRGLEARLESIEQLLQQMLEHQRVEETQNAASRRDRRR